MRPQADYEAVLALFETNYSDYKIARLTGVPRGTVQNWRRSTPKRSRERHFAGWRPPDPRAYCYALGLYLGDGHIVYRDGRARHLRLYLDDDYPRLIAEATGALQLTLAPAKVHAYHWGREKRTVLQICNRSSSPPFLSTVLGRSTTARSSSATGSAISRERTLGR